MPPSSGPIGRPTYELTLCRSSRPTNSKSRGGPGTFQRYPDTINLIDNEWVDEALLRWWRQSELSQMGLEERKYSPIVATITEDKGRIRSAVAVRHIRVRITALRSAMRCERPTKHRYWKCRMSGTWSTTRTPRTDTGGTDQRSA